MIYCSQIDLPNLPQESYHCKEKNLTKLKEFHTDL